MSALPALRNEIALLPTEQLAEVLSELRERFAERLKAERFNITLDDREIYNVYEKKEGHWQFVFDAHSLTKAEEYVAERIEDIVEGRE